MNRILPILFSALLLFPSTAKAQCLSATNPVGGIENLLALEKKSLRVITFYKGGVSQEYLTGNKISDYNFIDKATYNYLSLILGYGIHPKWTIETETGFFLNKTQFYNTDPPLQLTGNGFSNFNFLLKYNLLSDHFRRIYFSLSTGVKIPASRTYQSVDYVELPYQLQSSLGAYGWIFNASFVKENSELGMRYFVTSRVEVNSFNQKNYRPGTAAFTSLYVSKHLLSPRVKGDWTVIMQLRNEIRMKDNDRGALNPSTGSCLFLVVPQLNYVIDEKWNLSTMIDIPFYQFFNGTQMGSGISWSFVMSRTFAL